MKYNINGDIHPFEKSMLDERCVYCSKTAQEHIGHEVIEPTFCDACRGNIDACYCAKRTKFDMEPTSLSQPKQTSALSNHKVVDMQQYVEEKQREQVSAGIVHWQCPVCDEINCFDKSLNMVDPCGACGCPCGDML